MIDGSTLNVLDLLPHRDPFVWVTRIIEVEPGESVVAELDVDPNLPLFKGHFPGQPILPGVIIMEALAQAASCCLLIEEGQAGRIGYLAGIDKAKFRAQVKKFSRMCIAEVRALKGDKVCAQAVQKYIMGPSA